MRLNKKIIGINEPRAAEICLIDDYHATSIMKSIFLPLAILCALIAIACRVHFIPWPLDIVFGPLVIACLIGWIAPYAKTQGRFGAIVILALVISMVADFAIKFSFIAGLAVFLIVHIVYLAAFIPKAPPRHFVVPALIYIPAASAIVMTIIPGAREQGMLWPVVAYVFCVTFMAISLAAAGLRQKGVFVRVAIGGTFFFISDAMIGISRFAYDFPYSGVAILAAYWIAQALIASVLLPSKK